VALESKDHSRECARTAGGADLAGMRRLLLIPLAALGLYAGASVAAARHSRGSDAETIMSIGANSITFVRHHYQLSCRLTRRSPSTAGFTPGELVRITCSRRHVLIGIRAWADRHHHPTTSTSISTTTTTTSISTSTQTTTDPVTVTIPTTTTTTGTVTSINAPISALNTSLITAGSLTCQIGAGSPSTSTFHVGDIVQMSCTDGRLTSIQLDSF
jgi:hypothetical protein